MAARLNLSRTQFGRLMAIRRLPSKNHKVRWECICECGLTTVANSGDLRAGKTTSCGCRIGVDGAIIRKHGKSTSPEYRIWKGMRSRCNLPSHSSYKDYGGRGIKVCTRWEAYDLFVSDMGPRPSEKHSIDRIDNNKGYSPKNCRWALIGDQMRNKRSNVFVRVGREKMILAEALRRLGIKPGTYKARIKRGWSTADALIPPTTKGSA